MKATYEEDGLQSRRPDQVPRLSDKNKNIQRLHSAQADWNKCVYINIWNRKENLKNTKFKSACWVLECALCHIAAWAGFPDFPKPFLHYPCALPRSISSQENPCCHDSITLSVQLTITTWFESLKGRKIEKTSHQVLE